MLPAPPISATNRPPGRRAARTQPTTSAGRGIQCRAALEKTASTGSGRRKSWPSASRVLASPSRRAAAATMAGSLSRPITRAPVVAILAASSPVPQPRSSTTSPGAASSSSTTPPAMADTKPNCRW
jgi:hypothetical protein